MNDLDFAEEKQGNLWEKIAEDSNFHDQLQEAIKDSLVMGDGAFRFHLIRNLQHCLLLNGLVEIELKSSTTVED